MVNLFRGHGFLGKPQDSRYRCHPQRFSSLFRENHHRSRAIVHAGSIAGGNSALRPEGWGEATQLGFIKTPQPFIFSDAQWFGFCRDLHLNDLFA